MLDMISDWNLKKVGQMLNIPLKATDPDNDALTFSAMGLPSEFVLTDNGDGTGSITGMATTAGSYKNVKVTVEDSGGLSDFEVFAITVKDDMVAIPTYRVKKAEAEWDREKKILKVKGKLESLARGHDDEDMCSAMDGEHVTISNADGNKLFDAALNCDDKFKARKKVQHNLITCRIVISGDFLKSQSIKVDGCKDRKHDDDGDHNDEDGDEDHHHASVDEGNSGASNPIIARIERRISKVKHWLRSIDAKKRRVERRLERLMRRRAGMQA